MVIELKVITHLASLPYRATFEAAREHAERCTVCSGAITRYRAGEHVHRDQLCSEGTARDVVMRNVLRDQRQKAELN